jgi:hypothetical protein
VIRAAKSGILKPSAANSTRKEKEEKKRADEEILKALGDP